jgi:hypothetical protein
VQYESKWTEGMAASQMSSLNPMGRSKEPDEASHGSDIVGNRLRMMEEVREEFSWRKWVVMSNLRT